MTINPGKLTLAMARACMTAPDLQRHAKISDASFYNILHKRQKPRPATIGRIAAALGVDVTEIIEQEAP